MKKFAWFLMLALLSGCAKTITIHPPNLQTKFDLDVPFNTPLQPKLVKLVPKDGKKAITQDNVTVEVNNVTPVSEISDYIVSVTHPMDDNKKYEFELFPMLLKLKISNNSDHIITLTKTIVKLEDDNQNDYPMMNTMSENKQRLISQLQHSYQPFISNLHNVGIDVCKKKIKLIASEEAYQKLRAEISAIRKEGNNVRTPDMDGGYYLTEIGIQETLSNYRPENAAKRVCESQNMYKQLGEYSAKASKQMQDAIFKINQLPDNMKNSITNGVYQPINILPGRTETIVVPFGPSKEGETIKYIHVGIFDLPTRVDDAGNPTKRAHFNFDLVAAQ